MSDTAGREGRAAKRAPKPIDWDNHRCLTWGDSEIDTLLADGWVEVGLWDGYDTETDLPCGGPMLRRVVEEGEVNDRG